MGRRVPSWARGRKRWLVALTAVLVGAMVGGGLAIAGSGSHGIHKKIVKTYADVTVKEDFLDAPPKGQSPGDVSAGDSFFFKDVLWNRAQTVRLGKLTGGCTFMVGLTAHCLATATFPDGSVELAGAISLAGEEGPGTFYIAVTGGTERYENVVGEAKIVETSQENLSYLTLELIPSFSTNP